MNESRFLIFSTRKEGLDSTLSYLTNLYTSVSQPPARCPVPGPDINYTGPREVLLEFVILVF